MSHSIDKTLRLLGKSKNKAAARLLETALSSSDEVVRQLASQELVSSRGVRGLVDLIGRVDHLDDASLALFDKQRDKMASALRSAILSQDPRLNRNAFRIILSRQYFEILPTLLRILIESGDDLDADSPVPEVIDQLSLQYVQALDGGRQRRYLRETVLPTILRALSPLLLGFHRDDPPLIPMLFLRLYPFLPVEYLDTAKILRNSSLPVYRVLQQILLSGDIPTACDFIRYCFNNPDSPPLAQIAFSQRMDVPFLERIFESLDESVSPDFMDNLKRMQSIEWLDKLRVVLDQLEDTSQKGLVTIIRFAHLTTERRQSLLMEIFRYGKPAGRLAALNLLTLSSGKQIDQLVWQACDDNDPGVQSAALKQLRHRELPDASIKILQLADSPHALVRETVQSLMPDFRLDRFLDTFDQMSEEQRSMTFKLIKKIDPNLNEQIRRQLLLGEPIQQAKSLLCIEYGEMVPNFEDELCTILMRAETPAMRIKVAKLLAAGRRELSRGTLVQAFHRDTDPGVRAAAKQSLENRPMPWEVK